MATAPVYSFEPPPRLYMGVDYRWDPLFFQIPSTREPMTRALRVDPTPVEDNRLRVTDQEEIKEERHSAEFAPDLSCGATGSGAGQRQTGRVCASRGEVIDVTPSGMTQGDSSVGCHVVGREVRMVFPRKSNAQAAGNASSLVLSTTHGEKKRTDLETFKRPLAHVTSVRGATASRGFNDDDVVLSPRPTRSALLRRELNAHDASKRRFFGGFQKLTGQMFLSAQRTSLRAAGTRCGLKRDGTLGASDAVRSCFGHTNVVAKPPRSAANESRFGGNACVRGRSGIPPVPEFREILLVRAKEGAVRTTDKTVPDPTCGQFPGTTTSESSVTGRVLNGRVAPEEVLNSSFGVDRESRPCGNEGIALSSADVAGERCRGTELTNKGEEGQDDHALVEDGGAGNVLTSSCLHENEAAVQSSSEGVKMISTQAVTIAREGTLPPADVVEAVYSFSSDAFSDDTTVTPRSLCNDETREVDVSPLFWRASTLPMVAKEVAGLSPLEVSAEEDMPAFVYFGEEKGKDDVSTQTTETAHVAVSLFPSFSASEVKERLLSIPRYFLVQDAATQKMRLSSQIRSTTLSNYIALRKGVRAALLREFFCKWVAWIAQHTHVDYVPAQLAAFSAKSDGAVSAEGDGEKRTNSRDGAVQFVCSAVVP